MPPSAAHWLVTDKSLVPKYREYAQHIVVADENFLPTMFKNSPLCAHQVASNLVHVQVGGVVCRLSFFTVVVLVTCSATVATVAVCAVD